MPGTPSTGNATNTFAVDNTQRYQVIAQTACERIAVQENYNSANAPTVDLLMAKPAGATLVAVPKGTPAIFTPPSNNTQNFGPRPQFSPGQPAGEIQTATGSATVQQIEGAQV